MRRRKKWLLFLRLVSLCVLGFVAAAIIALSQIKIESLHNKIVSSLENAIGAPVEIAGDVSWKFSLRPRIVLKQVRVKNEEWAKKDYALDVDEIDVKLDLLSLLRRRAAIRRVYATGVKINLEKNSKGLYSLNMLNHTSDNTDAADDNENKITKYPFKDFGFGNVVLRNVNANVLGKQFKMNDLSLRFVGKKTSQEYSGWIKIKNKVNPFIMSFFEYDAENNVYPVNVAMSTGGEALIIGMQLNPTTKKLQTFNIKGDLPDNELLEFLFDQDMDSVIGMSVDLSGQLQVGKLILNQSSVSMRGNTVGFSGSVTWNTSRPVIKLNLKSNRINIIEIFPNLYGNWVHPNRELNAFHDMPLMGNDFRKYDLNINVDLKSFVVYRDINIKNIKTSVVINNGIGRIDVNAKFADGDVKIGSDLNINNAGRVFFKTGLICKSVVVGKLLEEVRIKKLISGLPVDVYGYFEADGTNMSEVMQTIIGPVQMHSVGGGYADERLVEYMYGTDFLTTLRHTIKDMFSSEKQYNKMAIENVAANLKLRNGKIETDRGVAIETNAINIRMVGDVDLGQETMDLALVTAPVRGLKISISGVLTNAIKISGNLSEPDVGISTGAVASKVASATGIGLLLAPFTGGLSFLAGFIAGDLLENWLADNNPAETAMESGAPAHRNDPEWLNLPVSELVNQVIK